MKKFGRFAALALAVAAVTAGASGQARAGILLDLTDPPAESQPYSFTFLATDTSTTVSFSGYNLPSFVDATNIGFFLGGGGPNLLGSTWVFTPAPVGSDAYTFDDGTSVPALAFGSVVVDSYDTFSQTVATTVGQSYTLDFILVSNGSSPSGFIVSTSALTSVPEPSSLVLSGLAGLMGVGYARSRRRRALTA